jgi:predicted phosphoribosyltransferase
MFKDRRDAGQQLAQALETYRDQEDVLVLAIPRGGVEVAAQIARHLNADISMVITRKLPLPHNPEAGFGAIAEDGSLYLHPQAADALPAKTVQTVINTQKQEVERRIEVLRNGNPLPPIEGQTVILVDDGIAMGSTMRATIELCKNQDAGTIIVAVPVASDRITREIASRVDRCIVLETPKFFRAVAQVYETWYDVSDEEVLHIMNRWHREHKSDSS